MRSGEQDDAKEDKARQVRHPAEVQIMQCLVEWFLVPQFPKAKGKEEGCFDDVQDPEVFGHDGPHVNNEVGVCNTKSKVPPGTKIGKVKNKKTMSEANTFSKFRRTAR